MASYAVGVDLGQVQDYTAIAIVCLAREYKQAFDARDREFERLERIHAGDLHVIEDLLGEPLPPSYEVRHLERVALGTRYPEVVARVQALVNAEPLRDDCVLAVDATGVGVAVVNMLEEAGLDFDAVTITSGSEETSEGSSYRVPKRDLVSAAQVLFQRRGIKIARSLPEADTLVRELLNFRYKITAAANITYESWREGTHDDLVLALCLAIWEAEKSLGVGGMCEVISGDELMGELFGERDFPPGWDTR